MQLNKIIFVSTHPFAANDIWKDLPCSLTEFQYMCVSKANKTLCSVKTRNECTSICKLERFLNLFFLLFCFLFCFFLFFLLLLLFVLAFLGFFFLTCCLSKT